MSNTSNWLLLSHVTVHIISLTDMSLLLVPMATVPANELEEPHTKVPPAVVVDERVDRRGYKSGHVGGHPH